MRDKGSRSRVMRGSRAWRGAVRGVLAAWAGLAAGAGAPLHGQEQPDTVRLDPVVVTATRLPTPRAAVATSVTLLDGTGLEAEGLRTVADALRQVPGLSVVQTGSYGSVTSVFMRGGESDYVKVLVDGTPINDPGGAIDFANLTTDNVERIEIVRGPTSVLYGSDAVSGVVQIFTRRGLGRLRASAGVRGGTYGSLEADLDSRGGTEHVQYAFAVARRATDGIHPFNSDYDNLVLSGMLRAVPDARTDAQISLRYTDSEAHFPTDGSGQLVDSNAFRLQDRLTVSLDAGRFITDRVEGRVLLALNETDGGLDDRPDGPADTLGFFGFASAQKISRRSADARVNWYVSRAGVVTLGAQVEGQDERALSESSSQFGDQSSGLTAARTNYAAYAQVQAEPLAGLALTVGARLDDNRQFGTFFTYRGGVAYGWQTGTRLRAAVGSAFKEPTFFENFADDPFARGNPSLEPERSASWEVGVEQRLWGARLLLGATYFDQRFRDLIQYTPVVPASDAPNYFNVAAADAAGVEFEVRTWPLGGLTVGGSYTLLRTEVVDAGFDRGPGAGFVKGERLLRRPTHRIAADAVWRMLDRAHLALRLDYVGDRDDRDFSTFPATPVVLPAYWRVDLALSVDMLQAAGARPGLVATLRVDNLLDEEYQDAFGFRAPGRRVLVGGRVGI